MVAFDSRPFLVQAHDCPSGALERDAEKERGRVMAVPRMMGLVQLTIPIVSIVVPFFLEPISWLGS